MGEHRHGGRIAVLSRTWGDPGSEAAFVVRSVAGAMSRHGGVDVLVPGPAGPPRPDGAFDLHPVGLGPIAAGPIAAGLIAAGPIAAGPDPGAATWPLPEHAEWPDLPTPELVLVDVADRRARDLLDRFAPGVPVAVPAPASGDGAGTGGVAGAAPPAVADHPLAVGPPPAGPGSGPGHQIGLHVPVNPLAAGRRHGGLGDTDYVLVLTDRAPATEDGTGAAGGRDTPSPARPTPLSAWIAARFPRGPVVVVEDATASVWRSRSLRGTVGVDTRTDLWRLVAHARVVVDLRPGDYVARECVESMRFGIPVVVPAGTAAAGLAAAGGGLWYRDVAELLGCIDALGDHTLRDALGNRGRDVAEECYGDPGRFVARVGTAIDAIVGGVGGG